MKALHEIQDWVAELIGDSTVLEGVPVIVDDGGYPNLKEREDALKEPVIPEEPVAGRDDPAPEPEPTPKGGLALTVWRIEASDVTAESGTGVAMLELIIAVICEENATVNRGDNGWKITAEQAAEEVLKACLGRDDATVGNRPLTPAANPITHFGKEKGVRRVVVLMHKLYPIAPNADAPA